MWCSGVRVHRHAHPEPTRCAAHWRGAAAEHRPADRYPDPRRGGASRPSMEDLRHGLRNLGYVEGQNIVLEYRFAAGQGRAHAGAGRRAGPAPGGCDDDQQTGQEPRRPESATKTIPIVTTTSGHYVVASLARPGGNITGVDPHDPRGGWQTARAPP